MSTSMMPTPAMSVADRNWSLPPNAPYPHTNSIALQRRERQLEEELQMLLDAQGEGLIAGLTQHPSLDASSDGTGSPTESKRWSRKSTLASTPRTSKPRLGHARRQILGAIRELATVKDEELAGLQVAFDHSEGVLQQVDEWSAKKDGLEREIREIESSQESTILQKLREDQKTVQSEVQELEDRLLQLRAQQRHLASEISRMTNSVEARLSSYKASLSLLESDVRRFLSEHPQTKIHSDRSAHTPSFFSLPAKRRTLDMAQGHWSSQQELLKEKLEQAELEKDALEEGAHVWEEVIVEVTTFEKGLRRALRQVMRKPRDRRTSPLSTSPDYLAQSDSTESPKALVQVMSDMDRLINQLDQKYKLAEARDWKLLMCCIGAELEALREGNEMLKGFGPRSPVLDGHEQANGGSKDPLGDLEIGISKPEDDNDVSREHTAEPEDYHDSVEKTEVGEDEDADPDPDLLVSHDDAD